MSPELFSEIVHRGRWKVPTIPLVGSIAYFNGLHSNDPVAISHTPVCSRSLEKLLNRFGCDQKVALNACRRGEQRKSACRMRSKPSTSLFGQQQTKFKDKKELTNTAQRATPVVAARDCDANSCSGWMKAELHAAPQRSLLFVTTICQHGTSHVRSLLFAEVNDYCRIHRDATHRCLEER